MGTLILGAYEKGLNTYLMISVIKVPIRKKSGNLFNDSRINVPILKKSGNLFNDPRINESSQTKKCGNLFNDPPINVHIQRKVWKLI